MARLLICLCMLLAIGAAPAEAAPGDLDGSFAGSGWVRTLEMRSDTNYLPRGAQGVAVQPDGAVAVAGQLDDGSSNHYFGVLRYRPDGSLDPSFGDGGWAHLELGSFEESRAVALQRDGKLVVAGETDCATGICFAVARFNPNGSPDGSFGAGGVVRKEFYLQPSQAFALAIRPDGRIVVAGTRKRGGDAQDTQVICVMRLLPDGRPDPAFSGDGVATADLGYGNDAAHALVLQGSRIVVAGQGVDSASRGDFGLVRFRGDGGLDRSFGRRGKLTVDFGRNREDVAYGLAAAPGGRLVVAGSSTISFDTPPQVAVARLTRSGRLDRGFGRRGRARFLPTPFGGYARAVGATGDGRVLVAGRAFTDSAKDASDWLLMRLGRGGRLDAGFGSHGLVRTDFGTGSDQANALALMPGRIVVVGSLYESHGVARYLTG